MLIVTTPFVGYGYNMPAPGALIDPPAAVADELLAMGVVARYEAKIDPLPDIKKNGEPLE